MSKQKKIFYLGFHKTGSTSFGELMTILGYKSQTYYKTYSEPFVNKLKNNDLSEVFEITDKYDAFDDDPWFLFYKEFEQRYENALFVLYERDPEKWYESCFYFFGRANTPMREFIYGKGKGCNLYNKDHHISIYRQHSQDVREYFKDKPEKFLEIYDLTDKSAQSVAKFIGNETSVVKFPHMNSTRLSALDKFIIRSKLNLAKLLNLDEVYVSRDD